MKKNILSGVQTTGNLHLGNYLGAIKGWLDMQDSYNCYFFLADLHAITVDQDPQDLHDSILKTIAVYLACGIDPKKSAIFAQSSISEHTQLAWLLNCITPISWLKRMTQFKDKAGKKQDNASTGLFTYPLLMAADILLYNPHYVPVGEDQKQHLELARDIAGIINRKFKQDIITYPEPLIQDNAARVMSLRDGTRKMSKSDENDASRINLTDSADLIIKKLKKAKTDNIEQIYYDKSSRPEISNLIDLHSSISGKNKEDIIDFYAKSGFAKFKLDIADIIIEHLKPISDEYHRIIKDKDYLTQTLEEGAGKAKIIASKTYGNIAKKFGFL